MKPTTEAMKQAIEEYQFDAMNCCRSCDRAAQTENNVVAFAHGWTKAMKFVYQMMSEHGTRGGWKYGRAEDLIPAIRAHAGISEQSPDTTSISRTD